MGVQQRRLPKLARPGARRGRPARRRSSRRAVDPPTIYIMETDAGDERGLFGIARKKSAFPHLSCRAPAFTRLRQPAEFSRSWWLKHRRCICPAPRGDRAYREGLFSSTEFYFLASLPHRSSPFGPLAELESNSSRVHLIRFCSATGLRRCVHGGP